MKNPLYSLLLGIIFLLAACDHNIDGRDTAQEILDNHGTFSATILPDFTWSAFQRFWHRGAESKVSLQGIKKVENGYALDYGYGVTLFVFMKNDMVSGVSVEYIARQDTYAGGAQFKRLMEHMLLIGTFRWSKDERFQLMQYYSDLLHDKREYVFKRSYFIREYNEPLWTFDFIFIEEDPNLRRRP